MPPTTEWYKITSGENDRLSILRIVNLCSLSLVIKDIQNENNCHHRYRLHGCSNIIDIYIHI